jgi:hypothetical protein
LRVLLVVNGDWCREPESNRHAFQRGILSPVRLPIPPSRQRRQDYR